MKKLLIAAGLMSLSSFAFSGELTQSCEEYLKQVDTYVEQMSKNEATKGQVETMKSQYDQAKEQFKAMPKEAQDSACTQAVEALKQANAAMPK